MSADERGKKLLSKIQSTFSQHSNDKITEFLLKDPVNLNQLKLTKATQVGDSYFTDTTAVQTVILAENVITTATERVQTACQTVFDVWSKQTQTEQEQRKSVGKLRNKSQIKGSNSSRDPVLSPRVVKIPKKKSGETSEPRCSVASPATASRRSTVDRKDQQSMFSFLDNISSVYHVPENVDPLSMEVQEQSQQQFLTRQDPPVR